MTEDFPFRDESAFQVAVAILFRQELAPDVVWWHTPNGEWRDPATARKLKDMGVRGGVADFLLFKAGLNLALELKTPRGVLSAPQKDFRDTWRAIGGRYEIARSLLDVRLIIWNHKLLKATSPPARPQ